MQSEEWEAIDGIKTRFLEAGRDSKELVVFIHGLGSSADRWLDIPLALSLYYHTLAVDLPGFGMADRPESGFGYRISEYADFLEKLVQKLALGESRVSLVGHSLGGYIAAEMAIRDNIRLNKLVLVDPSGALNGPTELLQKYMAAAMNPTKETVRQVFEQLVAVPSRIPDWLVDGFIFRMNRSGAKNAFRLAYENSVNTQLGEQRLEKISGIDTLVMWGKVDRLIPPALQSVFKNAIRGSIVVEIEDAGHAPFAEKPALACELIHRFLETNNPR